MKGITAYPFKNISITLLKVGLIAGTIAASLCASASSCPNKKGLSDFKVKTQLIRISDQLSPVGLVLSSQKQRLKDFKLFYIIESDQLEVDSFYAELHLFRYSGLSPPLRA